MTRVVADLHELAVAYEKVQMPHGMIEMYARPPQSPEDCIFARVTHTISADLQTKITPCQFGGTPDCANCGCIASAGLAAIGRHKLGGVVRIDPIFNASIGLGRRVRRWRERSANDSDTPAIVAEPGV